MTARRTLAQQAADWAISITACVVILSLMAWMDHQKSETDALRLGAQVSNDRAAEHAAINDARIAQKE